jgi:hypothetical protein
MVRLPGQLEISVSTKFRVTFDIDLEKISPDELANGTTDEAALARAVVIRMLTTSNRKSCLREMQRIRTSTQLTAEEKAMGMAECLRRAKLSLQAEANLDVQALPADAIIREDTEEREALAA